MVYRAALNGIPLNVIPLNGIPLNGIPLNGIPLNGITLNGIPFNGIPFKIPLDEWYFQWFSMVKYTVQNTVGGGGGGEGVLGKSTIFTSKAFDKFDNSYVVDDATIIRSGHVVYVTS